MKTPATTDRRSRRTPHGHASSQQHQQGYPRDEVRDGSNPRRYRSIPTCPTGWWTISPRRSITGHPLSSRQDASAVRSIVRDAESEAKRKTPIYYGDRYIYRLTVSVLGASVFAVIVAQLWIVLARPLIPIPDGIIAIGSAAIGALAGLLAPTPAN